MRLIRRMLGAAALLGAGFGILGGASPAAAYCGPDPMVSDGTSEPSNGCRNPCPDPPNILVKFGLDWSCPQ